MCNLYFHQRKHDRTCETAMAAAVTLPIMPKRVVSVILRRFCTKNAFVYNIHTVQPKTELLSGVNPDSRAGTPQSRCYSSSDSRSESKMDRLRQRLATGPALGRFVPGSDGEAPPGTAVDTAPVNIPYLDKDSQYGANRKGEVIVFLFTIV